MATGITRRTSLNTLAKEGLFWPKITDPDTLSADLHAMARALENDAETGQGKLSERPVAALRGRFFYVTEGEEKGLYWDTGEAWIPIGTAIEASQIDSEAVTGPKIAAGAVTHIKIGSEAVEFANIAAEAIKDDLVVAGRALVDTENSYGAMTARAAATNFTPSATRTVIVVLTVYLKGGEPARATITVGGVAIAVIGDDTTLPAGTPSIPFTFIVPPGVAWSWSNENIAEVRSSYLIL